MIAPRHCVCAGDKTAFDDYLALKPRVGTWEGWLTLPYADKSPVEMHEKSNLADQSAPTAGPWPIKARSGVILS